MRGLEVWVGKLDGHKVNAATSILLIQTEQPPQIHIGVASDKIQGTCQIVPRHSTLRMAGHVGSNLQSQVIHLHVGLFLPSGGGQFKEKAALPTSNVQVEWERGIVKRPLWPFHGQFRLHLESSGEGINMLAKSTLVVSPLACCGLRPGGDQRLLAIVWLRRSRFLPLLLLRLFGGSSRHAQSGCKSVWRRCGKGRLMKVPTGKGHAASHPGRRHHGERAHHGNQKDSE
mmetsp:Transcript_5257/g.14922  ORF Transcript_5257/g.14922 Transcript_5257/m.14922 type:complete len:229 (+) Transcript_5257:415-1101(+)